ncbi:DUF4365 domain-containing protein [Brevibacillus sp. AG]|uniref:DUF4365 domain-containing protein n=1 Tax=Brevibacillus sp. AG TaxID=3020891 RepID=UPI00232FA6C1|nr:DUF4365 domain-containing protein [Brevibacillus sp. AG]MDC0764907.1 DUF4365 domain-containing protein [Brevibacillus sp. AG]
MKLSNGKIERLAVQAIKHEANKPGSFLIASIPEGDKGVSFDGSIDVFIDDSETVESLIGSVPIQVKGNQVEEFSGNKRTFSLKVSHYQNYYNSNGVLLLVVEVNEKDESKIYYKQLLPVELAKIIKFCEIKEQKSKSIDLRPLYETSLQEICRRFLKERDNQPKVLIENKPIPDKAYPGGFTFSSVTFNPHNEATSNIFDHDWTLYGIIDTLKVPLDIGRISSVTTKTDENIEIDGTTYTYYVKSTEEENTIRLVIDDVLEFAFDKKFTSNFSLRFLKFHSLPTQLKVIPLIKNLLTGKTINLAGSEFSLNHYIGDLKKTIEDLEQSYQLYVNVLKVFTLLDINENTIITEDDSTPSLKEMFRLLVNVILRANWDGINELTDSCMHRLKVGDRWIVFYCTNSGQKKLVNAFSEEVIKLPCKLVVDGEDEFPHSIYALMPLDDLVAGLNVNHEILRASFDQIDPYRNDSAFELTNEFCITCIRAYDLTNDSIFLDTAEHIYMIYSDERYPAYNEFNKAIINVNLNQIRKRKNGQLSLDEMESLIKLKTQFKYEAYLDLHFCISVLLESKLEAKMAYGRMDQQKRDTYVDYPIYQLYKDIIKE